MDVPQEGQFPRLGDGEIVLGHVVKSTSRLQELQAWHGEQQLQANRSTIRVPPAPVLPGVGDRGIGHRKHFGEGAIGHADHGRASGAGRALAGGRQEMGRSPECGDDGAGPLNFLFDNCSRTRCAEGTNDHDTIVVDDNGEMVTRTFHWRPEDFPLEVATYMQCDTAWDGGGFKTGRGFSHKLQPVGADDFEDADMLDEEEDLEEELMRRTACSPSGGSPPKAVAGTKSRSAAAAPVADLAALAGGAAAVVAREEQGNLLDMDFNPHEAPRDEEAGTNFTDWCDFASAPDPLDSAAAVDTASAAAAPAPGPAAAAVELAPQPRQQAQPAAVAPAAEVVAVAPSPLPTAPVEAAVSAAAAAPAAPLPAPTAPVPAATVAASAPSVPAPVASPPAAVAPATAPTATVAAASEVSALEAQLKAQAEEIRRLKEALAAASAGPGRSQEIIEIS